MGERRDELAEAATDYVLLHGLIGLSLRPLAAALGTSDRMLLYHFAGKDDLVATVLRVSNDRSVAGIRALDPSPGVRRGVLDLWSAVSSPDQARCQRLYVEAAALGVLGA
jgi:AcrR family transcriptional regulator